MVMAKHNVYFHVYAREGALAAKSGEKEEDNPYSEAALFERCAWFAGFRDERRGK